MMFGRLIYTELLKLRRYPVLWVGVVGMFACVALTVVQTGASDGTIWDFSLFAGNVLWSSFDIFFPAIITLVAGYILTRELTDDTLKNILTVPISFKKLVLGKLLTIAIIAIALGIVLWIFTVLANVLILGFPGVNAGIYIKLLTQFCVEHLLLTIACLPIIVATCKKPNLFPMGVGLAFFYGFCGSMTAGHGLSDYYPPSATLTLIGYDNASGGILHHTPNAALAGFVLILMLLLAMVMLYKMKVPGELKYTKKKKKTTRGQRP